MNHRMRKVIEEARFFVSCEGKEWVLERVLKFTKLGGKLSVLVVLLKMLIWVVQRCPYK